MAELSHVDLDEKLLEIVDKAARQNIAALQEGQEELKELCDPDVILSNAITETTSPTMPNSYGGRLLVEEIGGGESEQFTTSGKQFAQDAVVGTATAIYNTALSVKADFKPNTQYTFSFKGAVGNRYYVNEYMFVNDISFTVVDGINTFTVTTKGDISEQLYSNGYLILKNHKDQSNQNKFEEVMVVEGATSLPYEPYTGGIPSPNPSYPQEIKKTVVSEIRTHGKNFFDIKSLKPKSDIQSGTVIFDNDVANISSANQTWATCQSDKISVEIGKSYILKIKVLNYSATTDVVLAVNNGEGRRYSQKYIKANGYYQIAFVATTNTAQVEVVSNDTSSKATNTLTISEAQLEEGTVATEYEPYTESAITLSQPIELYNKNGVQDVIEGNQIKRKVKALKVTDFSNISVSDDKNWYDANKSYSYELKACKYPIVDASPISDLCTHFKTYNFYDFYSKGIENGVLSSQSYMVVNISKSLGICKTVDEFRQWCIDNDVTFYKELATETTEALPIADQIALNSLATYDGITYLEFDSEIKPTFKGRYGASEVGAVASEAYCDGLINGITAQEHYDNKENPHGVTKAQVGLGNVENKSVAEILNSLTKEQVEALRIVASALSNTVIMDDVSYGVGISSGFIELFKDNIKYGLIGANAVQTNGNRYNSVTVRGTKDAEFITFSVIDSDYVYFINARAIPLTDAGYTEPHYFRGDMRVVGNVKATGGMWSDEFNINKLGLSGGAAQPVEWVWDGSLQRWVLCTITEQQE